MQAGVAPVLISDNYPLPPHVPWETFLLRIAEKDITRLPQLISPHLASSAERGRRARQAWLDHFAPEREFDAIVNLASAALRHRPPVESVIRTRQRSMIARATFHRNLRGTVRAGNSANVENPPPEVAVSDESLTENGIFSPLPGPAEVRPH